MKKQNLIKYIPLFILLLILIFYICIPSKKISYDKQGNIVIKEKIESNYVVPYDVQWGNADNEIENNYPIALNDDTNALAANDFLPLKAHFLKSEKIGSFLLENEYNETEVTVLPESLKKNGNNSSFSVQLDSYTGVILTITYFGLTEEFEFEIVIKEI